MRWRSLLTLLLLAGFVVWLACDLGRQGAVTSPRPTPLPPPLEPYDRASYRHWIDADHDCQDTRQEVLIAESLEPVRMHADKPCRVARGRWRCAYTGRLFFDPKQLDVDHLVPLKNAHVSGAGAWSRARRAAYANDLSSPEHLVAVSAHENRAKGSKGPEAWRPPDPGAWCWYGQAWQRVKARWGLTTTQAEREALHTLSTRCSARRGQNALTP